MKIKAVYGSMVPRIINREAIVLYPFIFFWHQRGEYLRFRPEILKHELVHVDQIQRMGVFRFYIAYISQVIRLWFEGKDTWSDHTMEKEALIKQWEPLTDDDMELLK